MKIDSEKERPSDAAEAMKAFGDAIQAFYDSLPPEILEVLRREFARGDCPRCGAAE